MLVPFIVRLLLLMLLIKRLGTEILRKLQRTKNIPHKILKSNSDICVKPLTKIFKECIENSSFPNELKCADVTSLPKNRPTNFRPISVLLTVSINFE